MYKNGIYGAIIGDLCGSYMEYAEFKNREESFNLPLRKEILKKDFPLFNTKLFYTDDTILTTALADAVISDKDYEKYLKSYGLKEILLDEKKETKLGQQITTPQWGKFGKMFIQWCKGDEFNESYGNGCAMRISPVAYRAVTLEELEEEVLKATKCTHNHPESIKCAMATAKAIYYAKNNFSKQEIKKAIESELEFKLNFDLKELQKTYKFTSRAIDSVPQALFCFLESSSFEDTIRLTLSIGGDTDTNAAIACSVGGAYYGISDKFVESAKKYLPKDYVKILDMTNQYFDYLDKECEI